MPAITEGQQTLDGCMTLQKMPTYCTIGVYDFDDLVQSIQSVPYSDIVSVLKYLDTAGVG